MELGSKAIRMSEWWRTKVPFLLFIFILALNDSSDAEIGLAKTVGSLLAWMGYVVATAAAGYLINNFYDREQDVLAGKKFVSDELSAGALWGRVLVLFLLSLLVVGWVNRPAIGLLLAQYLAFMGYSIPPLRWKERGYAAAFTDAFYAFVAPVLLTWLMAGRDWSSFPSALLLWTTLAGIRNLLLHQIRDRKADQKSNTQSVPLRYGLKHTVSVLQALALLEMGSLWYAMWMVFPASIVFGIAWLGYAGWNSFHISRYGMYPAGWRKWKYFGTDPNPFYEGWLLPLILLVNSIQNPWWLLVLIPALFLFRNQGMEMIKTGLKWTWDKVLIQFLWYRVLGGLWHQVLLKSLHGIYAAASLTVNYSIYYYRRIILHEDDRTARRLPPEMFTASDPLNPASPPQAVVTPPFVPRSFLELEIIPGPLTEDNLVVNGLWIGDRLSRIELLCIKSFLAAGHRFKLWIYQPLQGNLPDGVELEDANQILPASKIFRYKYANTFGHGKGSVSGFSDVFRYKLLYEKGGWWVDMDVSCLQPLRLASPYFFRAHHHLKLVGNVMKCPAHSELMKQCFERAVVEIDENNRDWHKPIAILEETVFAHQLQEHIYTGLSNPDIWEKVKPFVSGHADFPSDWRVFHWMNEEWRSRGINKNDVPYYSALGRLLLKHHLLPELSTAARRKNDWRHRFWVPVYEWIAG